MATSGTTTFNLTIDDLVEEAYERCGIRTASGYDLKTGRRSLNLLLQEWNNRGINLWKVELIANSRNESVCLRSRHQRCYGSLYF